MRHNHSDKLLEPIDEREPTIDPERCVVDAHHHLWPRRRTFGYTRDEYIEDARTHNVIASVFVECVAGYDREAPEHLKPVGETRYVLEACPVPPRAATFVARGIVGRAELLTDAKKVREALEAHIALAPHRFRGIRY